MKFFNQDLQLQTTYSDGRSSIDEIVRGSIANGRTIIGLTDHADGWVEGGTQFDFFKRGEQFEQYLKDIEVAKQKYKSQGVTVLTGLEVEINVDGTMSLADGILEVIGAEANLGKYVDYAIGVIHSECFTDSLKAQGQSLSKRDELQLLMQNIAGLIANSHVRIWGHPFQVVHGHYLRSYTPEERQEIMAYLKKRTQPLFLEYNLNPLPRYEEWGGKSTHYETGRLVPNDMAFYEDCIAQLDSHFVVSTDAHDVLQTRRLTVHTVIPTSICDRIIYFKMSEKTKSA